jgi:hypothetical protein
MSGEKRKVEYSLLGKRQSRDESMIQFDISQYEGQ